MTYIAGHGTTIGITIGSTVTALGQVTDITPPKMARAEIETTHLLSAWKEKIAAIPDGGDFEFTVEWEPKDTTHGHLWTSFQAGTAETWTITLSDLGSTATTISFSGFIKEFPWDAINNEAVVTIKFTVSITGAVTITPAT